MKFWPELFGGFYAAGILETVFVFDRFIWQTFEKPELEPLCERKLKLMDYAEATKARYTGRWINE